MMQLTITDAGRAALVNAANTGTLPITLDKVVLGSALYSPVATQTALQDPIKTITSFGADAVADDTIHITITDESADVYELGEIGIYAGNTLFGIYSQATPILEKGASQMVLLSADIQFTSVPVDSITVGDTSFAYPQATETRMGVMKIATSAKVTEGTDHTSAVTPKTLKQEISTRLGKTENAASATKLATARTISLTGDATGSALFDGSGNISIPVTVADDSHAHVIGNVDGLQAALDAKLPTTGNAASATKLATARTISLTGDATGSALFDGSGNISIPVTVADDSHAHVIGNVDGLQAALDAKLPTTGNAASATKLATARTISLTGDATGSASFDGSGNIAILVTVTDDSHAHVIGNVDGLQAALDAKLPTTGNAASATKLATARTISLTGDATGSASFDGTGNIAIPVTLAVSESIQPGMVFPTAQNGVPAGFLECNGAAISRTAYAALYARLGTWWGSGDGSTTFNVPDLRGVFIRGLDNGRGLDAGRTHGTYQADAFQGHGHFGVNVVGFTGGWGDQNSNIGTARTESAGTTDKGYGTPRIASETRPKNVAMRYCIKY